MPEHLRLGTWDLVCGWANQSGQRVEPRLALQLIHESVPCSTGLREQRSLSRHRGFELANGLPFVASDVAIHSLLAEHTVAEAQRMQIALGRIRRASGDYAEKLLAIDPHRTPSFSKRQMRLIPRRPAIQAVQGCADILCHGCRHPSASLLHDGHLITHGDDRCD